MKKLSILIAFALSMSFNANSQTVRKTVIGDSISVTIVYEQIYDDGFNGTRIQLASKGYQTGSMPSRMKSYSFICTQEKLDTLKSLMEKSLDSKETMIFKVNEGDIKIDRISYPMTPKMWRIILPDNGAIIMFKEGAKLFIEKLSK